MSERDEVAFTLGKKVFNESDLEFQVTHNGEVFTMKHPAPFVKVAIEADIARKLGGLARDAYPAEHVGYVEAVSYVEALVVTEKSPKWWKSAWTCYDDALIYTLFRGYYQFRENLQERIRGDGPEEGGEVVVS